MQAVVMYAGTQQLMVIGPWKQLLLCRFCVVAHENTCRMVSLETGCAIFAVDKHAKLAL